MNDRTLAVCGLASAKSHETAINTIAPDLRRAAVNNYSPAAALLCEQRQGGLELVEADLASPLQDDTLYDQLRSHDAPALLA